MSLSSDFKKDKRITIGFTKTQMQSIKILESYGVNISQFARLAIKEKIKKDWKNTVSHQLEKYPNQQKNEKDSETN